MIPKTDVVIIGGGFTGLGVAAGLCVGSTGALPGDYKYEKESIPPFIVLESGSKIGGFWDSQYSKLMFHTPNHHLPYSSSIRTHYPCYLSGPAIVSYFEEYAKLYGFQKQVWPKSPATHISRLPESESPYCWMIKTTNQKSTKTIYCKYLVVCTGLNCKPYFSPIPNKSNYQGDIIHSRSYKNAEEYKGKKVLVIGSGNSAIDQATDLANNGIETHVSMRTPRHFVIPKAIQTDTIKNYELHKISAKFQRVFTANRYPISGVTFGSKNLIEFNIGQADSKLLEDPYFIPNFDQGFITALEKRKIKVIPSGVKHFTKEGVEFDNGKHANYDSVIMATGYRTGLDDLFQDKEKYLEIKEPHTRKGWLPKTDKLGQSTVEPSLFFVGYQPFMVGLYNGYGGFVAGEKIAANLQNKPFSFEDSAVLTPHKSSRHYWVPLLLLPVISLTVYVCLRKAKMAQTRPWTRTRTRRK